MGQIYPNELFLTAYTVCRLSLRKVRLIQSKVIKMNIFWLVYTLFRASLRKVHSEIGWLLK